jgi:two-component system, NarL family, sensor kinase
VLQTRVLKCYNAYLKNGFASAVKQFIRQIDKQQLKITYFLDINDKAIDNHIAPILFRIFQEMVINAIIHSEAKNLDITFVTDKKGLSAIIEDNGVGFDLNRSHTKGLGMVNSKSRIAYLNGTLEWSSVKGKGTIVAIYVPLG